HGNPEPRGGFGPRAPRHRGPRGRKRDPRPFSPRAVPGVGLGPPGRARLLAEPPGRRRLRGPPAPPAGRGDVRVARDGPPGAASARPRSLPRSVDVGPHKIAHFPAFWA